MTKELQLGIPTPCTENWSRMSPGANGRFCSSCQKTVLDFTAMEDKEIIQWFTNHQGSTCGRFRPDQLNRPIAIPPEKKSRWRYWHYLVAGLLFSSEVSAQTKPATRPMSQHVSPDLKSHSLLGDTILVPEPKPVSDSIRGRVLDENGRPVQYATIKYNKAQGVDSDDSGYFSIPVNKLSKHATLYITAVGYKAESIAVKQFFAADQTQLIVLKFEANIVGKVAVK
jgi:hypothetical protein